MCKKSVSSVYRFVEVFVKEKREPFSFPLFFLQPEVQT